MRDARLIMGMRVLVEIVDKNAVQRDLEQVFAYFEAVDQRFSPFKPESEISRFNRGELDVDNVSAELREIFDLAHKTKRQTDGYFDIARPDGRIDPCGIVKGWAIRNAAALLTNAGFRNFMIEAGGDIETRGRNARGEDWRVAICNPFEPERIVKVLCPGSGGVATSGNYFLNDHIYNPHTGAVVADDVASITIIAADALEADRYATAAFAMGRAGISFVESVPRIEGYMIDRSGMALMTSGLARYLP